MGEKARGRGGKIWAARPEGLARQTLSPREARA